MRIIFACVVSLAILAAASVSAVGQESGQYTQGKQIYQDKCQACHGENGQGNGPMASAFSTPPQNFTQPQFWQNNPDQRIQNAVENGYKLMPPIDLTPTQIKQVTDYILRTFK